MIKPEGKVESLIELLTAVGDYGERTMFRGQVKGWSLLPSIGRLHKCLAGYEDWEIFHQDVLEQFQRNGRPHFKEKPLSDVELLIHAQHHGLPTRLLDWSTNPAKALFFAVNDPQYDSEDGVLWMLEPQGWWEQVTETTRQHWDLELAALFPEHLNERLIAQQGCFLSFPMPRHCDEIVPLESSSTGFESLVGFQVPAKNKALLRNQLRLFGIDHGTMFPGLDGVARSIRFLIESSSGFLLRGP